MNRQLRLMFAVTSLLATGSALPTSLTHKAAGVAVAASSVIAAGTAAYHNPDISVPGRSRLTHVKELINHPWNLNAMLHGWDDDASSTRWFTAVHSKWRNNEFHRNLGSGLNSLQNAEFHREVLDTINNELQVVDKAKLDIGTSSKWYDKLALKGFFGPEKSVKSIEQEARKKLGINPATNFENLTAEQFNALDTEVLARIRNEVKLLSYKRLPIRVHLAWFWLNNHNRPNITWTQWMTPSVGVSTEFTNIDTGIFRTMKKAATKWVWPFWWNFEAEMEFIWELRKKQARLIKFKVSIELRQGVNAPIYKVLPLVPIAPKYPQMRELSALPTYEQATGLPTYAQSMQGQHAPSAPAFYQQPSAPAYDYPQYQYGVVPMPSDELSLIQGYNDAPIYC